MPEPTKAKLLAEAEALRKALARETAALNAAREQQLATSEILQVISRSQTDVQPVFDAIVGSAVRLLGDLAGALTRVVGDQVGLDA